MAKRTRTESTDEFAEERDQALWGPKIVGNLEALCRGQNTTLTAWAKQNGIDRSKLMRWKSGSSVPDLVGLREVADAMPPLTLGDLLVASGVIRSVPRLGRRLEDVSIDRAIENDPDVTDEERDALRAVRAMARRLQSRA
jgi:hypothetical protein